MDTRVDDQCAEIVFDLGLCKIRVISNNPRKLEALEKTGLDIVEPKLRRLITSRQEESWDTVQLAVFAIQKSKLVDKLQ